ncbi:MAG: hypothetical protein ABSB74_09645 [Tepidisphaeraceae bacterium]
MKPKISINGPFAASALDVAYRVYRDIHPATTATLDPIRNSGEFQKAMELRIKSIAKIALNLLGEISEAIPEDTHLSGEAPDSAKKD